MKRVVLRISALVSVVVLGLIAIAQAQRGAETATEPPDAGSQARAASAGEPRTIVPAPEARMLPGPDRFGAGNPLRGRVAPASAEGNEDQDGRRVVPPAGHAPAIDPFGDRAQPPDRVAARSDGRADAGPPPASAPPAAPSFQREPAPFQLDPGAPSSSIPPSRPLGGPGAPGTIPDLNAAGADRFPPAGVLGAAPDPSGGEGTGQPGPKTLEGPQSPQVTIQKIAPPEVQVGSPAKFKIKVVNTGTVTATSVELRDQLPRNTRLVGTAPPAQRGVGGELVWNLGTMPPGQEATVEIELVPTAEGEIGSVAAVHYTAEASARTVATKPELDVQVSAANQVVIGEQLALSITVSNPGSGVAAGVVLEEHVPAGFQHPAGTELEYEVGTLKPGESRKLELVLTAAQPGAFANVLIARGQGNLRTEARHGLTVLAPQLDVALLGPSRRYLEREATYTVSVSNPGTAPARDVALVAELPPGMKFVEADNQGHYEEATRTVHWRLAELPANMTGSVKLTAMPVEPGQKMIRVAGSAERVATVQKEHAVEVEGIVAINFQVADAEDPIEKNGETTYEIRVFNQGSKTATNVQLEVALPPEMRMVAAEGPARHLVEAGRVRFEGLARLAPKAETTYRVRVQGLQPGDLRIRVQLQADEMERPVVKEESTRVYSDE